MRRRRPGRGARGRLGHPEPRPRARGLLDRPLPDRQAQRLRDLPPAHGALRVAHLGRAAKRDMPQDLVYLAMIESGFNPKAYSSARASGLWQFIGATARRYGLDINRAVDERNDPVKATSAALDYLTDLHERFGSWYLAAAAYNMGENGLTRILRVGARPDEGHGRGLLHGLEPPAQGDARLRPADGGGRAHRQGPRANTGSRASSRSRPSPSRRSWPGRPRRCGRSRRRRARRSRSSGPQPAAQAGPHPQRRVDGRPRAGPEAGIGAAD